MIVNGIKMNFKNGITVLQLLTKLNLDKDKVVVEVNRKILDKKQYSDYLLNENDRIEIINLVGGG
ncbi:sulfur carrier protein [Caminicella sporogenes DSM 14501]|uniref:Sulfur carrier protein n=1 Tax=Caminicella sporogenes DSM 14501 TaxID=1121266 RepID=A0A1M6RP90_9FIRM|nr:sulfur carrier protein ThiS [Caminicella sporogenes]RKD23689.1 thiamine biosynthesis protein ThiS [Caminicella sporogenes]WIF94032.1 sulfur carrier protein ThiS [Caminicella sporogenes]SHK34158.1 sulfur carrier protein [Caminicella sporogenes DSM 14501]